MSKKNEKSLSEKDIVFEGNCWVDKNGARHRYVDPMSDEGFKLLFGSEGNEDLLMGLLNSILPQANIVKLAYKNVEHLGMFKDDGKAIFDVYCEDANGVRFLVEMQNWSQRYFNKRAVYYSTYAIQDQALSEKVHQLEILEKDEWDYNYAQVYLVCFLNFNMRKKASSLQKVKEDEYLSIYRYRDLESGEELGDGTTLVFVEMKKFDKRQRDCKTDRDRMLCTIKNMSRHLDMPDSFSEYPLLKRIYRSAEIAALPSAVRISYISHIMNRNDMLNSIAEQLEDARAEARAEAREIGLAEGREEGRAEGREEGLAEGREEGLAEGREEGHAEERVKNARNLRDLGVDLELIATATGLSVDEIQNL